MIEKNSFTSNSRIARRWFQSMVYVVTLIFVTKHVNLKLNTLMQGSDIIEHEEEKISGIINHAIQPDFPVFGSSVAYLHFNPDIISGSLGKSVYNFGLDGTSIVQYKGLLKEFISYTNAGIIVIAAAYYELGDRTEIHAIEKYEPYLSNKNIYDALFSIDPLSTIKYRYIPFYDFIWKNDDYRKIILGQYYSYDNSKRCNGFEAMDKKWLDEEWMSEGRFIVQAPISDNAIKSYQEIIQLANQKGIKILLILAPIYIDGQKEIKNLDEVRSQFKILAGKGNYFMDFTKHELCEEKVYFYNNTHLNKRGADIFSAEFSKQVMKLHDKPFFFKASNSILNSL